MARVTGPHGFLATDLARRFISADAMAIIGEDVADVALVCVIDSDTGRRSTVIGDGAKYRTYLAKLAVANELDDDETFIRLAGMDLSAILPIEREGFATDWLAELEGLAHTTEATKTTGGGYDLNRGYL